LPAEITGPVAVTGRVVDFAQPHQHVGLVPGRPDPGVQGGGLLVALHGGFALAELAVYVGEAVPGVRGAELIAEFLAQRQTLLAVGQSLVAVALAGLEPADVIQRCGEAELPVRLLGEAARQARVGEGLVEILERFRCTPAWPRT